MRTTFFFIIALVVLISSMRACSPGYFPNLKTEDIPSVTLQQVKTNIETLEGNLPVIIQGRVIRTFYLGLFNGGLYRIEDASGDKLTVTTRKEVTPAKGDEVILIVVPKVVIRIEGALGIISAEYQRLRRAPVPSIEEERFSGEAFSYNELH